MNNEQHGADSRIDILELQATDALLDRLAARATTTEDRLDDAVALLVSLTDEVDAGHPVVPTVAQLRSAADEGRDDPAGTPPAPALRSGRRRAEGRAITVFTTPRGRTERGTGRPRVVTDPRSIRLSTVAAVAATAAMVLTLGSLSLGATPLDSVGGIIAHLTHGEKQLQVEQAEELLAQAQAAMDAGRSEEAAVLLAQARAQLAGVDQDVAADVLDGINLVQSQIGPVNTPPGTPAGGEQTTTTTVKSQGSQASSTPSTTPTTTTVSTPTPTTTTPTVESTTSVEATTPAAGAAAGDA
ncbi:MAG: hypothetical protein GXX79_21750 [Actinomycetales bacterium]|nr:hypothetical protein [Actinomycetales bacterium]